VSRTRALRLLLLTPRACRYRLDKAPRYATAAAHAVSDDSWNERHVASVLALPCMHGLRLDGLRVALDTVCGAGGPGELTF
jgi:hypothetical protein